MANSKFSFIDYKVAEIKCEIADKFNSANLAQEIAVENHFDPKQPQLVEVVLNVTLKAKGLYFYLKIKGLFKKTDDMADNLFRKLSKQNAPAILYPFARSLIASYTAQANIPAIVLPTVNFVGQY